MSIIPTAEATKAEMLAYIEHLEERAIHSARANAELRERISVLEGSLLGLKPHPQPQNNVVVLRGVPHNVFIERRGARITKRFVPIEASEYFADCEE